MSVIPYVIEQTSRGERPGHGYPDRLGADAEDQSAAEPPAARHTGRTPEQIAADTERDKFLSAPEALAYGLIDRILVRRESE